MSRRRHDDVHFPLQGRGKRAPKIPHVYLPELVEMNERTIAEYRRQEGAGMSEPTIKEMIAYLDRDAGRYGWDQIRAAIRSILAAHLAFESVSLPESEVETALRKRAETAEANLAKLEAENARLRSIGESAERNYVRANVTIDERSRELAALRTRAELDRDDLDDTTAELRMQNEIGDMRAAEIVELTARAETAERDLVRALLERAEMEGELTRLREWIAENENICDEAFGSLRDDLTAERAAHAKTKRLLTSCGNYLSRAAELAVLECADHDKTRTELKDCRAELEAERARAAQDKLADNASVDANNQVPVENA